jgi:CheY-like chemotaxis protein
VRSSLGYSVVEASSPLQALRLRDEDQQVTLLFTDVVMADMSRRRLADRLRQKRPKRHST